MTEEIEAQRVRWVQMLIDCPKRSIHFGPGPILVDPTADLGADAFWAWMEQWFGGDAQDAEQIIAKVPQGDPAPARAPVVRQLALSF